MSAAEPPGPNSWTFAPANEGGRSIPFQHYAIRYAKHTHGISARTALIIKPYARRHLGKHVAMPEGMGMLPFVKASRLGAMRLCDNVTALLVKPLVVVQPQIPGSDAYPGTRATSGINSGLRSLSALGSKRRTAVTSSYSKKLTGPLQLNSRWKDGPVFLRQCFSKTGINSKPNRGRKPKQPLKP